MAAWLDLTLAFTEVFVDLHTRVFGCFFRMTLGCCFHCTNIFTPTYALLLFSLARRFGY